MARVSKPIYIDKGVSIYLRPGSPFWQLRITSKGFRHRESLDTSDKETAKTIARQRADSMLSNAEGVVIARDRTYKELHETYKQHAELRNQPSTRRLNYDNLKRITRYFEQKLRNSRDLVVSDFNLMALEAYANARKNAGKKPVTINREISSLSAFFGRAKRAKLIKANPVADFEMIPVPMNRKPRTLSDSEVSRLLEAAGQPVPFHGRGQKGKGNGRPRLTPIFEMILFILNTGARLAEAMFLEWDKVFFTKPEMIHFANISEHTVKHYEDRSVLGNPAVIGMLREHKFRAGNKRWVFSDGYDKIFDRKNLLRELKRVAKTAKIRKVNFLILRHTALTAWAKILPPFVLRELAGHADVRTSQRYYIGLVGGDEWLPPMVGG